MHYVKPATGQLVEIGIRHGQIYQHYGRLRDTESINALNRLSSALAELEHSVTNRSDIWSKSRALLDDCRIHARGYTRTLRKPVHDRLSEIWGMIQDHCARAAPDMESWLLLGKELATIDIPFWVAVDAAATEVHRAPERLQRLLDRCQTTTEVVFPPLESSVNQEVPHPIEWLRMEAGIRNLRAQLPTICSSEQGNVIDAQAGDQQPVTQSIDQQRPLSAAATERHEERGVPPEFHKLDKRILSAMLDLYAISKERRVTVAKIAEHVVHAKGATQPYVERMPELRRRGLTDSKRGKTGGHWLTTEGLRVAELLKSQDST
ncbi:MAG TPA: hypothetical protein VHC22_16340 [Pirellulales bacterium]|nr:hypothetical protein [Pirellulales bacterium]